MPAYLTEEIGLAPPTGELIPLGEITQKSGKRVEAWAVKLFDVFEACKLALGVLSVEYENGKGIVAASVALHAFGNLKAAIAKAEGRAE